jgi:hypothetical protein
MRDAGDSLREFIRASGTKGFKKSEVEVVVRNPQGQARRILLAEVSWIKPDKRHRRRRDYVTVMSLSQNPRSDLTYNVATNRFSITFHSGLHHGYIVLDELKEDAFMAVLYSLLSRSRGFSSNLLEGLFDQLPVITKYFIMEFQRKIKAARRSWSRSARQHRARRGKP